MFVRWKPNLVLAVRAMKSTQYVAIRSSQDLLDAAFLSIPLVYRLLPVSKRFSVLNSQLGNHPDWIAWRKVRQPTDRIAPFKFNMNTLAMRRGFVIIRDNKAYQAIVTALS
jgi:hypothetical protein